MMIVSKIVQQGLELYVETDNIPFQYSANHKIQFVKDSNYSSYTVQAYCRLPKKSVGDKNVVLLSVDENTNLILPKEIFEESGSIQISISLTNSNNEIINLGIVSYRIRHSVGDSDAILSKDNEVWMEYVKTQVDIYFKESYQSKLNDFNTKYSDMNTKYNSINTTAQTVADNLKKTQTSEANAKASAESASKSQTDVTNKQNAVNQTVSNFNTDYTNKTNTFNTNYTSKTNTFNKNVEDKTNDALNQIETKLRNALDNIPNDYTELNEIINRLEALGLVVVDGYICQKGEFIK